MNRLLLVFLLVFLKLQGIFAMEGACWESASKVSAVYNKHVAVLEAFMNSSIQEINVVWLNESLTNVQKSEKITLILRNKREDIVVLKWVAINELQSVIQPPNGRIIENGMKRFLGTDTDPTSFPLRCFVKEAKNIANKALDSYKFVAQRGIHLKKRLIPK